MKYIGWRLLDLKCKWFTVSAVNQKAKIINNKKIDEMHLAFYGFYFSFYINYKKWMLNYKIAIKIIKAMFKMKGQNREIKLLPIAVLYTVEIL